MSHTYAADTSTTYIPVDIRDHSINNTAVVNSGHSVWVPVLDLLANSNKIPLSEFPSDEWFNYIGARVFPSVVLMIIAVCVCCCTLSWRSNPKWGSRFPRKDWEKKLKKEELGSLPLNPTKGLHGASIEGRIGKTTRYLRAPAFCGCVLLGVGGILTIGHGFYALTVLNADFNELVPKVNLVSNTIKELHPMTQNAAIHLKGIEGNCVGWNQLAPETQNTVRSKTGVLSEQMNNVSLVLYDINSLTKNMPDYFNDGNVIVSSLTTSWKWAFLFILLTPLIASGCYVHAFMRLVERGLFKTVWKKHELKEHEDYDIPWAQLELLRPENVRLWRILGWDEENWNEDNETSWPESEKKTWRNLDRGSAKHVDYSELEAAEKLGFTASTWDPEYPEERVVRSWNQAVLDLQSIPIMVIMLYMVLIASFTLLTGVMLGAYCNNADDNTIRIADEMKAENMTHNVTEIMSYFIKGTPKDNPIIEKMREVQNMIGPLYANSVSILPAIDALSVWCQDVGSSDVQDVLRNTVPRLKQVIPFARRDWVFRHYDAIVNKDLCTDFADSVGFYTLLTLISALLLIPYWALLAHRYLIECAVWHVRKHEESPETKKLIKRMKKEKEGYELAPVWGCCAPPRRGHQYLIARPEPWK